MKPEQAREILKDAPEGTTHISICEIDGLLYLKGDQYLVWKYYVSDNWNVCNQEFKDMGLIHDLSDLRQIVEQAERIETAHEFISTIIVSSDRDYEIVNRLRRILGE